jgi:hypothetical protein
VVGALFVLVPARTAKRPKGGIKKMLDNNNGIDWLEDAIPLDVFQSRNQKFRRLVDHLFDEIATLVKITSEHRQK